MISGELSVRRRGPYCFLLAWSTQTSRHTLDLFLLPHHRDSQVRESICEETDGPRPEQSLCRRPEEETTRQLWTEPIKSIKNHLCYLKRFSFILLVLDIF